MKAYFNKTALLLLLSFTLVLSACGNSNESSNNSASPSSSNAGEEITLKVPTPETYGDEGPAVKKMYEQFMADNPNVKLNEVTVQDVNVALAAGDAPDLLLMETFQIKEHYKLNNVEPLDAYSEKYGWGKEVFPWAKNSMTADGKLIAVPWNFEGLLLVYNKTLFEEKGWSVPQNYKEWTDLSAKIKDEGLMPIAHGTANCAGCDDWWVASMVNGAFGPDGTKELFSGEKKWTDPDVADLFKRFSDYWNKGYMTNKESIAVSLEDSMQLFATGQAAMRLDGTWSLSTDMGQDFEIGYAPFPSFKDNGTPVIPLGVGGGLAINANSAHKDEVAELINYAFKPEILQQMAEVGAPMPVNTDYNNINAKPSVKAALQLLAEASMSGKSGYLTWTYASPSVVGVLESEVASVYLKPDSINQLLEKLQKMKEKDAADNKLYDLDKY